jgi:hypothetical protein
MAEDASRPEIVLECFARGGPIVGQQMALLSKSHAGRQKMSQPTGSFCPECRGLETEREQVSTFRRKTGVCMRRIIVLLALVSAGSPGVAQKVRVDYDHGCNFSRYKTYRWVEAQRTQSSEVQFPNQLMRERIVDFVEEALAAKQFTRVETGGDLLVDYAMRVSAQPQFTTVTDTVGPAWGWGGWGWASPGCCAWGWGGRWGSSFSLTTAQTIFAGTLVVSMTDARRKQLVFEGVSTDTISSKAEKNTKRLQKGVCEIFEKYPPKK